ncbi:MAG: hypothetical protein A2Z97_12940 [Bdellovibrionales bacterium GWB1_52_6]|nr:MAG: hypothetical protein A2Z97_12940 [Bdellovibrionales bacterium GWB1_52_6]OFZ05739.1 MAG: hypothetical protein A2X97_03495 [Bdellovibrionales bacterium GWA1_52_35]
MILFVSACSPKSNSSTGGSSRLDGILPTVSPVPVENSPVTFPETPVKQETPPAPSVLVPISNPIFTASSHLAISGTCTSENFVILSGADQQTVVCSSSSYSFTTMADKDGVFEYALAERNAAGIISASTSLTWVRDTVLPNPVAIETPSINPYVSSDMVVIVRGFCEPRSLINVEGAAAATSICDQNGKFNLSIGPFSSDGNYAVTLLQTDEAGNSSAPIAFTWIRNTDIPPVPVIFLPGFNPAYEKASEVTISGSCSSGHTVELSGGAVQSTACTDEKFAFLIPLSSDGVFDFQLLQRNAAGTASSGVIQTIIRDTIAPAAPIVLSPPSNKFTSGDTVLNISGTCEHGATVAITAGLSEAVLCSDGKFAFNSSQSLDGSYLFTITQTDSVGNVSLPTTIEWTRNTVLPTTPTITSPLVNPYVSSSSLLLISGACTDDHTVSLRGSGSGAQPCVGMQYSFAVEIAVDGIYSFEILQTSATNVESGSAVLQWTRDTTLPEVILERTPAVVSLLNEATFSFSANKAESIFQCRLDSAQFANCVSPIVYSGIENGTHRFEILATDSLGNSSATLAYNWQQEAYSTLALYHFDSTPGANVDSSLLSQGLHNDLEDFGTSPASLSKFGQARAFDGTEASYLSAGNNESFRSADLVMTVESFVKLNSNSAISTIASKSGGPGQVGWTFYLKKISKTNYSVNFAASLDGITTSIVKTGNVSWSNTAFAHLAVTWNRGSVKIFVNGVEKASGTIGSAGVATLFPSTAPLMIGRDINGNPLDGVLDELRISRVLRWDADFKPSAGPYVAD